MTLWINRFTAAMSSLSQLAPREQTLKLTLRHFGFGPNYRHTAAEPNPRHLLWVFPKPETPEFEPGQHLATNTRVP